MLPDINEALRYLGVPAPAPAELRKRAESAAQRLAAAVQPRWVYRVFPLSFEGESFALSGTGIVLSGKTAQTMLAECASAAVLAGVLTNTVSSGWGASRRNAASSSGTFSAATTSSADGHSSSRKASMAKLCPAG